VEAGRLARKQPLQSRQKLWWLRPRWCSGEGSKWSHSAHSTGLAEEDGGVGGEGGQRMTAKDKYPDCGWFNWKSKVIFNR
jgi:hypothetical protein